MEQLLKDLLQLGFSFFVAGYLLVWGQRTQGQVIELVRTQGQQLELMRAALVRIENLLEKVVELVSPS